MVDFVLVPERTVLVNVDMQNCFVYGSPFSAPDGLEVLDRSFAIREGKELELTRNYSSGVLRNARCGSCGRLAMCFRSRPQFGSLCCLVFFWHFDPQNCFLSTKMTPTKQFQLGHSSGMILLPATKEARGTCITGRLWAGIRRDEPELCTIEVGKTSQRPADC